MKIIGVNTSTSRGGVALLEGTNVVDEVQSEKPESFSRSILGMLDQILSRNGIKLGDLDGFGVASGPGSFTGIRIGQATIAGVSLSSGIPIYGVSTLEAMATAMAESLPDSGKKEGAVRLIPMLDAGRGNSYYGVFSARSARSARGSENILERISEDRLAPLEEITKEESEGFFFGEGAEKYKEMLKESGREVAAGEQPVSIAVGAAVLGSKAAMAGSEGDIFCLRPNYIHGGPANIIQQPN